MAVLRAKTANSEFQILFCRVRSVVNDYLANRLNGK